MAEERYKQPSESRLYHFVFSNLLESAEIITSIGSVAQANLGNVDGSGPVTIATQAHDDNTVQLRISGGTVLESYKLTTVVNTNNSNILELDGILHVREL